LLALRIGQLLITGFDSRQSNERLLFNCKPSFAMAFTNIILSKSVAFQVSDKVEALFRPKLHLNRYSFRRMRLTLLGAAVL
jgi:hypothetical protein